MGVHIMAEYKEEASRSARGLLKTSNFMSKLTEGIWVTKRMNGAVVSCCLGLFVYTVAHSFRSLQL